MIGYIEARDAYYRWLERQKIRDSVDTQAGFIAGYERGWNDCEENENQREQARR